MTPKKSLPTMTDVLRERIQAERSVYYVAQQSGVSAPQLVRFVSGERDLRLATADKLATFFNLELRPRDD